MAKLSANIFSKNIKEDQKITKEKMKEIVKSYSSFNKNVESFASKREEFYKLLENAYYSDKKLINSCLSARRQGGLE